MTISNDAKVCLCFHPSGQAYGSDRVFLSAVAALQQNYKCIVVLQKSGPLVQSLEACGAVVHTDPTTFVLRRSEISNFLGLALIVNFLRGMASCARLITRYRPELVYASTITMPASLIVGRFQGLKVLCHVHEAETQLPWGLRALLTAPLFAATKLIVVSEASGWFLTSTFPGLSGRVAKLLNPVDRRPSGPLESRCERPAPLRLGYLGRLSQRKGVDVLLRATGRLRRGGLDLQLHLWGDTFGGAESYVHELQQLGQDEQLSPYVYYHGFTDDLDSVFSSMDCLVVPSRVEPFGLVAIEGRIWGVPVIVSDIIGLRETIDFGAYGWAFRSEDDEALAGAILSALNDWASTREIADRSRASALDAFSPSRFAKGILAIAEEAI